MNIHRLTIASIGLLFQKNPADCSNARSENQKKAFKIPPLKRSLLLSGIWLGSACATLLLAMSLYQTFTRPHPATLAITTATADNAIVAYAALPASVSEIRAGATSADARPITVEAYLKTYASPLQGLGDFIVRTSDKHGVDPYLVVAIGQQESNLCKIIPDDSHNCWGWGIHSEGTLKFDNYEEAIQAVIRGLKSDYLDKGYTTPEQIMDKYTPLSNGSWAQGVNQFLAELISGNF